MSDRRPEHYVGAKETHYLICDKRGHLALVLAKMEAWQRYVDRDPHRDGWFWMSARQMSEQMMGIVGRSNANKYMNELVDMGLVRKTLTDDPQEPTKWSVDMDKLASLRSEYADENGYVDAGADDKATLSVESDTPSVESDTTKSPNNDCQSNNQTRTHEEDRTLDDPRQSLDAYIMHIAAKLDYNVSPGMASSVALRVASSGLSDDDERRYILDSMASRAANDKPPGKWAHYCGLKSDVEQWQGEDDGNDDFFGLFD